MKRIIILIIIYLSISNSAIFARQLQALLSHATFYSFTEGPYVETYLSVRSKSCVYVKNPDGKYRANINVIIMFKQDTLIKNFKKYNLSSNPVEDTSALSGNFIDVQRFLLPNGSYKIEISLTDINNPEKTLRSKDEIVFNFKDDVIHLSDIEFVESYKKSNEQSILSKSGYDLVPQIINFFPNNRDKLIFYSEMYNLKKLFSKENLIDSADVRLADADVIAETGVNANKINVGLDKDDNIETISKKSASIFFRYGQSDLDKNYNINKLKENTEKLIVIEDCIKKGNKIISIEISSWASPEGKENNNSYICKNRANTVEAYLKTMYAKIDKENKENGINKYRDLYKISINGKDKKGFIEAIKYSNYKEKGAIVNIIEAEISKEEREKKIKEMSVDYTYIEKMLAPLRRVDFVVNFSKQEKFNKQSEFGIGSTEIIDRRKENPLPEHSDTLGINELLCKAKSINNLYTKLKIYKVAISLHPNNWKAYNNVGYIDFKLGNYDEAELSFEKANSLSPNNDIIINNLNVAHNQNNNENKVLIKYYIESFETQLPLNDFAKIKKDNTKPVIALLSEFDISKLPSGNYNFVIDVLDQNNKLLASNKIFFQRSNPDFKPEFSDMSSIEVDNTFAGKITDRNSLENYIDVLYPISSVMENEFVKTQIAGAELKTMQQYFYNFWLARNMEEPEKAWLSYFERVKKVDATYSTRIKRGFETDRGRVYLKYGVPNTIVTSEHEPSAYPYEIWHYYKIAMQNDVRFVFYEPDLVTNNYELIHSTAIGEVHNEQWEITLYKRNTPPGDQDQTSPVMHYGSEAEDYYKNPR